MIDSTQPSASHEIAKSFRAAINTRDLETIALRINDHTFYFRLADFDSFTTRLAYEASRFEDLQSTYGGPRRPKPNLKVVQ